MKKKSIFKAILQSKDAIKTEQKLARANKKAEHIVEQAVDKSAQMLDKTTFIDKRLRDELSLELKSAVAQIAEVLKVESQKSLEKTLLEFSSQLKEQLKQSQILLEKKVNEEYTAAKNEIDERKKNSITTMEAKINNRVNYIAKQVIHRSLSASQHQKLVLEALQQAKSDGLFEN